MRASLILLLFVLVSGNVSAQKVRNHFFALHNIIRGDSTYNTFDKQVKLIKEAGYDGLEINQVDSFNGMKEALDQYKLEGSYFYVRLNPDTSYIDVRLKDCIRKLKGSRTIIAPFFISDSKRNKPSTHGADQTVVEQVRQLADWAGESGLQVAIYPHIGFYVERTDHALSLAKQVNRKNAGLTFNLCHWLATTTSEERSGLKTHLAMLKPYLKMITISGANEVMSQQKNVWNDYILPLGTGSYDTYGLLKYMIRDLKFQGPIGAQCYGITGDKPALIKNTITVWKEYKSRLETE